MGMEFNRWTVMSPMHCAIRCTTNTAYLKLLIDTDKEQIAKLSSEQKHKFVNATEINSWTATMIASHYGNYDALVLLINNGADVNAMHIDGHTALSTAAQNGHTNF